MSVLDLDNLSVTVWGFDLLKNISLKLNTGEVMAIIGPNGAGKTSLINTLVNNGHSQQVNSGEVMLCGRAYNQWEAKQRAKHVALLPQLNSLAFPFVVEEVIGLGRIPHDTGCEVDTLIVDESLRALDILHLKNRLYTQLSGGEKQRIQLARVMVQVWRAEDAGERLLLLDEPTSSLDLGHQQQLMEVIRKFADQGVAILMVVHDINLVSTYADKVLALCCGEVFAQGEPKTVINSELMKQLYTVDVDIIKHPKTHQPLVMLGR